MHQLLTSSPGPIFLLAFALGWLVLRTQNRASQRLTFLLAAACAAIPLALALVNLARPGLVWHDEANVFSIAAAWRNGQPMYPPQGGERFYALFYGPVTFLQAAAAQAVCRSALTLLRVFTVLALSAEFAMLYALARRRLPSTASLGLLALCAAMLLSFPEVLFGYRVDLLLLLAATAACLATDRLSSGAIGLAGAAAAGGLLGVAAGCKPTALVLLLPLAALARRRKGAGAALLLTGAAAFVSLLPFALPGIELSSYLACFAEARHQGLLRSTLLANGLTSLLFLLPLWAACPRSFSRGCPRDRIFAFAILAAWATLAVTGAKATAGGWHLWPIMPLLVLALSVLLRDKAAANRASNSVLLAAVLGASAVVAVRLPHAFRTVRPVNAAAVRAGTQQGREEIDAAIRLYAPAHNVSMGYGVSVTDFRTDLRYELPLAHQAYLLDENAVVEARKEGLAIPQAAIDRVLGCSDVWLVPHGEPPFAATTEAIVPNIPVSPLFPSALREDFPRTHRIVHTGEAFDTWMCNAAAVSQ